MIGDGNEEREYRALKFPALTDPSTPVGNAHRSSDPGRAATAGKLVSTIAAIDDANGHDPNTYADLPLALVQGRAASCWLAQLDPGPSDELQLAVRAHHLRRWELQRANYPAGRQGYLRWRRENKAHQASALGELMHDAGWSRKSVEQTKVLLGRARLRTDPDTQTLEDAACLVFLETQFDAMAERTEHDHLVAIIVKTLKKMSADAVSLASSIGLSTTSQAVLTDAIKQLGTEDPDDD